MDQFRIPVHGKTPESCVYIFGRVRVSALTDRLLRVEHSRSGRFCDAPTQVVWNRAFAQPRVSFSRARGKLTVATDAAAWVINRRGKVLAMRARDGQKLTLRGNLKGTRRTLDATFGAVKLDNGLMARGGAAALDDSKSLLLDEQSHVSARRHKQSDKYYFCYSGDYRGCLRDFYQLTGPPPMVPRFALGNWWSRYKAYTQQEYLDLMERFSRENIPLTVATVDMDWHWVDLRRFGDLAKVKRGLSLRSFWASGWTGYSWNTDLFPDYRAFLRRLHEMGLRVTLNLHPADGVRPFEDAYAAMAKAVGLGPAPGQPIPFDLTDPKFLPAYFNALHHPLEAEGVDFWWIDWQQGHKFPVKDALPGLDPLWALNHYHYYDNARKGQGLILSRYAGPGSHRTPLGFSGDTAINWRVLRFQPYFTANAANIGCGWWSHDIGGHHWGRKDDELYLRWLQFGVFSPINRLHSTSNPFAGKEPWLCGDAVRRCASGLLRLRHRLIPYIYTMAKRAHETGIPLCEPLYYAYPEASEAYLHPNTYLFGSELLVAPITEKCDPRSNRAGAAVWLPPGRWTDIFTNQVYQGGRTYTVYRGQESIPVFAKAGAVVPMAPASGGNNSGAPAMLHVDIWRGNNTFTLYEDEGETTFTVEEKNGEIRVTIAACKVRDFTLCFRDILECQHFKANDKACAFTREIILRDETSVSLVMQGLSFLRNKDTKEAVTDLVSSYQLPTDGKKRAYGSFAGNPQGKIPGKRALRGPIQELLDIE